LGILLFLGGALVVAWLIYDKLWQLAHYGQVQREVTAQPLFYLGLTLGVMGVQLFLAGFIGELIVRHAPNKHQYLIREKL
jgi:hypothetical protein